jgi:hypothetical protein
MSKVLLIVPGTGDPNISLYTPVYDLIKKEGEKRGYKKIIMPLWAGHTSNTQFEGTVNLESAVETLVASFGCSVMLECLRLVKLSHEIGKITFWGPVPLYVFYKIGKRDLAEFQTVWLDTKGSQLDETFYTKMFPVELHFENLQDDIPCMVATGTEDVHCNKFFFEMLKSSNSGKKNLQWSHLPGLAHEVKEPDEDYFSALFFNTSQSKVG